MSNVEHSIRQARTRLALNRALVHLAWVVTLVSGAWTLYWVAERVFAMGTPAWMAGGAAIGLALLMTAMLSAVRRVELLAAAVTLDQAAGLKERLSTALVFARSGDAFAVAARRDAERTAGAISVRAHVPLCAPRQWPLAAVTVALAVGVTLFLPPLHLFASSPEETSKSDAERAAIERERINIAAALEEQKEKIRALVESNPAATDVARDVEKLALPQAPAEKPDDVRREAVKELESLANKLADLKNSDREDVHKQLKRMLAGLEAAPSASENEKLASALSQGDFAAAKQALDEMRKVLEAAAKSDDPEAKRQAAEARKKLESISRQISQAAGAQQMQKELENKAGMSAEQAREMLEQLSKMDPDQLKKELDALKKRLASKGLSKEQVEKLAQKLANNKEAMKQAQKLADALKKAAQGNPKPDSGESQAQKGQPSQGQKGQQAQQGGQGQPEQGGEPGESSAESGEGVLAEAQEQLDELEMAEQQLNDLEARMAELENLKDDIAAGNCQGPEGDRNRIGQQGPKAGLGEGARIGAEPTPHQYKVEKAKSRMQRGKIIGQTLVGGEQVKGRAEAVVGETVAAALRDAAEAIDREELPRQYESAQRQYFDRLAGLANRNKEGGGKPAPSENPPKP